MSVSAPREPLLNIPRALSALIGLLCAIHIVRTFLPADLDQKIIWIFGFVPARYDTSVLAGHRFFDVDGAGIWSFVSYALLHANFNHIAFNLLWLLPFGSAVARRFGAARFWLLMIVSAIAGAFAHLLTHAHEAIPMIGASAAISGAMGAAVRFAFEPGSFLSFDRRNVERAAYVPALPLLASLRNPRVLFFIAIWFGTNIIFGIGSLVVGGESQSIAWQAHIGGFLAGVLLFSWLDPAPRHPSARSSRSATDLDISS